MRLTLRVTIGPMRGREFSVDSGQMVKVGRTDYADRSFSRDAAMSGVHFRLEVDRTGCYIEDIKSCNGTKVNEVFIKGKRRLADGDEIVAGETSFVATILGGPVSSAAADEIITVYPVSPPSRTTRKETLSSIRRTQENPAHYTVEKCASGLHLCRGIIDELPPAELALRLSGEFHPYLIVDFKRLGQKPPEGLNPLEFLFDWFEPAVAVSVSPVLIAARDLTVWPSLIEAAWGKDAVVCFFSEQEPDKVWAHLRKCCRARMQGGKQVVAVLGFCWPGVLVSLLSHSTSHAGQLCAGMNAVLTESPDLPDTWQLYGGTELPAMLEHLGLIQQTLDQAAVV